MKLKKKSKIEVDQKLSHFAGEADSEEKENAFMNPVKKRGRPLGSKNKAHDEPLPPSLNLDADNVQKIRTYIAPVVELCSEVGFRVSEDEKGRLSPQETEIITQSAASCINLYLPNVMGRHADLIVLTITMAQWSARVFMLRKMNLEALRRQHAMSTDNPVKENSVPSSLGGEIMQ